MEEVRARNRGDFVPDDFPPVRVMSRSLPKGEILDTLRIKMNFATVVTGEAFQQFGDGPLGTVAAVHERGNDGNSQFSASLVDEVDRCRCLCWLSLLRPRATRGRLRWR